MSFHYDNSTPDTAISKVELSFACRELVDLDTFSLSDPQVIMYMKDTKQTSWNEVGRTEIIWNNLNPNFVKTIIVDYHFETMQQLQFVVVDIDKEKSTRVEDQELIGVVTCTLAEIITAQDGVLKKPLLHQQKPNSKRGFLLLRGEEVSACPDVFHVQFNAQKLPKKGLFSKPSPFVIISRATEGVQFQPVYRSDVLKGNVNPSWTPATIPIQTLCNGDYERTLKVEVFSHNRSGRHDLIGGFETNLNQMLQAQTQTNELNNAVKKKTAGTFKIVSARVEKRYTLLDYVRGGYQISLSVAIDFTSSNGDPRQPNSLHFRQNGKYNDYQSAIRSIGDILDNYDSDHRYPVYGYGGKLPPNYQVVSHCFNANMNPYDPYVQGVDGILQAYDVSLNSVKLHGPTNFASIIRTISNEAKENMEDTYQILLMLTDGIISDMEATIGEIVHASTLPMSIIIVGIGNADFASMDVLDADDTPLVSRGVTMESDIVQFVPFREYAHAHPSVLAAKVLEEIPDQFLGYMQRKGIRPREVKPVTSFAQDPNFGNMAPTNWPNRAPSAPSMAPIDPNEIVITKYNI